jgi:hypothetical protein
MRVTKLSHRGAWMRILFGGAPAEVDGDHHRYEYPLRTDAAHSVAGRWRALCVSDTHLPAPAAGENGGQGQPERRVPGQITRKFACWPRQRAFPQSVWHRCLRESPSYPGAAQCKALEMQSIPASLALAFLTGMHFPSLVT